MPIRFVKNMVFQSPVFPYLIRFIAKLVRADGMVSFIDYELIDPYSQERQAGVDHPNDLYEEMNRRKYTPIGLHREGKDDE